MRDLNEICEPTTNFSTLLMDLNFTTIALGRRRSAIVFSMSRCLTLEKEFTAPLAPEQIYLDVAGFLQFDTLEIKQQPTP